MSVLNRSELEASPLADLHALASELGLDGFRRLRKAELIDVLLKRHGDESYSESASIAPSSSDTDGGEEPEPVRSPRRSRVRRPGRRAPQAPQATAREKEATEEAGAREEATGARSPRTGSRASRAETSFQRVAEGTIELLGNGSAFLRLAPPEPSDEDVYVSAAQVRRCELVSGDRVSGPVRPPRRSERYPSLVRVDSINGTPADEVAEGTHYEDLPAEHPSERLALGSEDATLKAIEWLTPIGRGSRVSIVGAARSGKSEALRRLAHSLAAQDGLHLSVVLAGVRPEEVSQWRSGPVSPTAALSFGASADAQSQALDRAVETAKRIASRGEHAVLLIDTLDGVHQAVARRALAAARNLVAGGSLTVVATASSPHGGETTVIALDAALTATGRLPALDLLASGTIRPELLVGDAGAEAIAQARTAALA